MELSPLFTSVEKLVKRYSVAFTLVVMYQGLFGGLTIGKMPDRIHILKDNVAFKLFTLFCALMLAADMPVSVRAASRAAISAKRSRNSDIRDMLVKQNALETEAMLKRRKRLERTAEEILRDNARSKTAKARMQQRNGD